MWPWGRVGAWGRVSLPRPRRGKGWGQGNGSPHSTSHFGLAPLHWLGGARVHSLMLFMHDTTQGDHGFSVSETMHPDAITAHTSATKNLIIENLLYFVEMKHIRIGARALHFDRVVATRKW